MLQQLLIAFLLIVVSFVMSIFAQDAPQLPTTTAGQRVAVYLKAFNLGDEAQMREFFAHNVAPIALEQRPVAARLEVFQEMHGEFGRLELKRVLPSDESQVTILVSTQKSGWLEIGFEFEAKPPHKMLSLRVEDTEPPQGDAPKAPPTAPKTEGEMLAALQSHLAELVKADEFSGTVLLAKAGKPLLHQAYGLASKEFNVPNRPDTKFNLGSINKTFTQMAIGQLVAQGKIAYEDTLGKHLPDYPNREAAEKVTIRQMLSMSSGIGDFFGPKYEATPKNKLRTVNDFLPLFAGEPLAFAPGTRQQYSNGGYIVLGAIIEKVTGQDYYAYVRENIFQPAGMSDTEWFEADAPTPNLATGYTRNGNSKVRQSNIYTRPAKGSPAGGGYSTAPDLFKFALALQSGKLRAYDFRNPNPSGAAGTFGGLGIAGGAPGINAVLEIGPANGYTLIVMSNYDPPSAEKVARQVRGWLNQLKK
jgi:CubicO group peptidase (beta-lactamase class C family)